MKLKVTNLTQNRILQNMSKILTILYNIEKDLIILNNHNIYVNSVLEELHHIHNEINKNKLKNIYN